MVMLSVPFALIGGMYTIFFLKYNFSVAVWVGFIALYGVAGRNRCCYGCISA